MPRDYLKLRFRGLSPHRFDNNPLELAYALAWQRQNTGSTSTLAYMLNGQDYPVEPTDREYEIAATVVQWLGSPVGAEFVRGVLREIDDAT